MTHLFIIVVLIAVHLAGPWAHALLPSFVPPWAVAAMTIAPQAVLAAAAWLAIVGCVRRLDRHGDLRAVRWSGRVLTLTRGLALAWHLASVFLLGALGAARDLAGDWILLDEILAAAPALALLLWTFRLTYPIEKRIRQAMLIRELDDASPVYPFPSPWRFVLATARNNAAIMALPLLLILAWSESLDRIVAMTGSIELAGLRLDPAIQVAGALLIFALIPPLMVRVWDTVPIPKGPLRDELERLARVHRVRVRGFLVWRTGGAMLNAAVIGLTPWLRYIVLTDALLDHLPEIEVEAVAAHEIAHVRKRHMIWLAIAVLGSAMLTGELLARGAHALPLDPALAAWLIGAASLITVLLVLGLVSRRFEWQADAFAARHLAADAPVITHDAAHAMSRALARVSRLNGMPEGRFTWRHGSIAARRQRLETLVGTPVAALPIDRHARLVVALAILAFIAGAALTAANAIP